MLTHPSIPWVEKSGTSACVSWSQDPAIPRGVSHPAGPVIGCAPSPTPQPTVETPVSDTATPAIVIPADATPMMVQYLEIKRAHPDCLLFYRMGDFYEMFFEDAVTAAAALDIALTKRGQHLGEDIPMCGVPVHSRERYLSALDERGIPYTIHEAAR